MIRWIGLKHRFPLLTPADEDWIMDPLVTMTENRILFSGYFNGPGMFLYKIPLIYLNIYKSLELWEKPGRGVRQPVSKFLFLCPNLGFNLGITHPGNCI